MDALISGKARVAALIVGDRASLIDYDGNVKKESQYNDAARQFHLYDDTIFFESINQNEALVKLRLESDKNNALLFALTILDKDIPSESKSGLARILDGYLSNSTMLNYIRGIMYSRPLPNNAIENEDEIADINSTSSFEFVRDLISSQHHIKTFYETWQNTSKSYQTEFSDIQKLEGVFINNLISYSFSKKGIEKHSYDNMRFNCLSELSSVPNSRQIVTKLFKTLDPKIIADQNVLKANKTQIDERPKKRTKPKQTNIHKIYQQVTSQIRHIVTLLEANDQQHALQYTQSLIDSQVKRNDHAYAAMSLCQLSEAAKSVGDFSLQKQWAEEATRINPDDGRAYGHLADAYLNLGHLEEAYQNFEAALTLGESDYGYNGLARIERARHNFDVALAYVEKAVSISPEYNNQQLKAELYRDTGELDLALELYKSLMEQYPEKSQTMCGYGAVLTDQGQFKKAEDLYRSAIKLYPEEQVPATSLGFLLSRMGKFKEAGNYLDLGISRRLPGNIVPFSAKAKAMQIKGDFHTAKDTYVEAIDYNKFAIEPWHDLIEMLSETGDLKAAKIALSEANKIFSNSPQLRLTDAIVAYNEQKFEDALSELDILKRLHPNWIKVLETRADILKNLGHLDSAREQYLEILSINKYQNRALSGIRIIDALQGINSAQNEEIKSIVEIIEIHDWEKLLVDGLVELANGEALKAKAIFLNGYKNTPFRPIKEKFALNLAVSRNALKQHGTAKSTIKNLGSSHAIVQKIIISGELGKTNDLEENVNRLKNSQAPNVIPIANLLEARYRLGNYQNEPEVPGFDEIMSENIKTILLAA